MTGSDQQHARAEGSAGRSARSSPSGPREVIVTIDGPAGTGKSSVAREAARRLGLDFLDTGAMYRAATAIALDHGVSLDDEHRVVQMARDAHLRFDWTSDPPTLMAFGRPVGRRLRDPDVDAHVSSVAGLPRVRELMVEMQQRIGREHPRLLTEGRDQGSVVFPGALIKIFLEASVDARAKRRADQLRASEHASDIDEARIARDLELRDRSDRERTVGPLMCPIDASVLDTSDMSFEEVVATVVGMVRDAIAREQGEGSGRR